MKYRISMLLAAAAFVFLFTACQNQTQSGVNLRIVDHEAVFRQSAAGKESMAYLQGMNQKLMSELTEMQQGQENATEEQKAQAQTQMQGKMTEYRMQLQGEQERIIQALNDAFTKAIENYRENNDVQVVLAVENVISYDPALDVTEDIIASMNEMDIEIQPAESDANPTDEPAADTEAGASE
jgi:outer membrane protein